MNKKSMLISWQRSASLQHGKWFGPWGLRNLIWCSKNFQCLIMKWDKEDIVVYLKALPITPGNYKTNCTDCVLFRLNPTVVSSSTAIKLPLGGNPDHPQDLQQQRQGRKWKRNRYTKKACLLFSKYLFNSMGGKLKTYTFLHNML